MRTHPFDPAELLDDAETQAAYLRLALAKDGPAGLPAAQTTVARAQAMKRRTSSSS